jgi:hypothetical protein
LSQSCGRKSVIVGKVALPVLREMMPAQALDGCCSVSIGALDKALGKRASRTVLEKMPEGAVEVRVEHHLKEVRSEPERTVSIDCEAQTQ